MNTFASGSSCEKPVILTVRRNFVLTDSLAKAAN